MISRLIAWALEWRMLVLLGAGSLLVAGAWWSRTTPVDAIPDLSDPQVIVFTEIPGLAPQVIEDAVTYPLVRSLLTVPRARVVRGQSLFGASFIYVLFDEGTDRYWARSRVLESLASVSTELPAGARPRLGPDATGVGWVFQYAVEGEGYSLDQLRSLQDWTLKFAVESVPGVAEVASLGGFVRQYQVVLDPARLLAHGVTADRIARVIRTSNADIGARTMEIAGGEYMVRNRGYLTGVRSLDDLVVATGPGAVPIRVRDVADVTLGPDLRLGIAERDGRGEAVGGIVIMREGGNALQVIDAVKERLRTLEAALPPGVRIVPTYDRSALITRAVGTLTWALVEESLIVAAVCFLFLLHARSALVAIAVLPLGIVIALGAMRLAGVNANIMSLGGLAIAIGAMIDAAIVMIENFHKHRELAPERNRWDVVRESTLEVGPALFISLLIITLSFIPLFALQGEEGRLFRPLALTKTLAMAAAAMLSVTVVPVLMGLFLTGRIRPEQANPVNRWALWLYRPVLRWALRHRAVVLAGTLGLLAVTLWPLRRLGVEFMPPLDEGALMYMPNSIPGLSIAQQRLLLQRQDSILMTFPEVAQVWGKAGRATSATDPAPISMTETIVTLHDPEDWPVRLSQDALIAKFDRALRFPGLINSWTMPIKNRTDMLSTGVRTSLGIKIFGPDLRRIEAIGAEIERQLSGLAGTTSIFAERSFGGRYLDIETDPEAAGRYGLTPGDIQEVLATALGGATVTWTVEGREQYPVQVRFGRDFRDDPGRLGQVLIGTPSGEQIPLALVAGVRVTDGAPMIRSENGQMTGTVFIDVRGRDIGGYLAEARAVLDRDLILPTGYRLEWSGQYEALERVRNRLIVVVPLTLVIIALLLYVHFRNFTEAGLVLVSLPFAMVGSIWLLWALDYHLSVAVAAGLIALAGLAAQTGVVMLLYLDHAWDEARAQGSISRDRLRALVEAGALLRVRPKLMTVVAIMAGLLPLMWGRGSGASVMQRIAAPMLGGMVTSTLLTLVVIPVLYEMWRSRFREVPGGENPGDLAMIDNRNGGSE